MVQQIIIHIFFLMGSVCIMFLFQCNNNIFPLIFHKVSESGSVLDDLDLQGLALQVGEALVSHVQQRVAEKPAGTQNDI